MYSSFLRRPAASIPTRIVTVFEGGRSPGLSRDGGHDDAVSKKQILGKAQQIEWKDRDYLGEQDER
jgi:hypothetical protein